MSVHGEEQCARRRAECTVKKMYIRNGENMRKYESGQPEKLLEVVCNGCGRKMLVENGYLKEGCFSGDNLFGYFSRRDGEVHHFDLCEDCYEKMMAGFVVPVEKKNATELV